MHKYHADIGIPPWVKVPNAAVSLSWTHHARREADKDRLPLLASLTTSGAKLFEVVTDDRYQVVRLGYRLAIDDDRDICLVVAPEGKAWRVVTCWANHKHDSHRTLRREEYESPWSSKT